MSAFEEIPVPQAKPDTGSTSILDDLFNYATKTFDAWIDYEQWDFTRDYFAQQAQVNPYAGLPQQYPANGVIGGVSNDKLVTTALLVGGAVLLFKVLK